MTWCPFQLYPKRLIISTDNTNFISEANGIAFIGGGGEGGKGVPDNKGEKI